MHALLKKLFSPRTLFVACDCELLGVMDRSDLTCHNNLPLGSCSCKPGVRGRRCDECDPGSYGLLLQDDPGVCKRMCKKTRKTRAPVGVEAARPSMVQKIGGGVEITQPQFKEDGLPLILWKEKAQVNIVSFSACLCQLVGTMDLLNQCDQTSGHCTCKNNIEGAKCDLCKDGYYSYPVRLLLSSVSCNWIFSLST